MRASKILSLLAPLALAATGCDAPRGAVGSNDPDASSFTPDAAKLPDAASPPDRPPAKDLPALEDLPVAPALDAPPAADAGDAPAIEDATDAPLIVDAPQPEDVPPDATPPDAPPPCESGRLLCEGMCVDPLVERSHCGGCGRACDPSQRCERGACVTACDAPRVRCGGACVDPSADPMNCGACARACPSSVNAEGRCEAGRCGLACAEGFGDCDMDPTSGCEVNLRESLSNCGRCGVACPGGSFAVCAMGACATRCAPGQTLCGQTCADILTSADNCGACGNRCGAAPNATGRCVLGACALTCGANFGDCDRDASNGCETDLRASASHCGACGAACATPPGGAPSCASGRCAAVCPTGRTLCRGACVDTQTDNSHCGRCDSACGTRSTCGGGSCSVPVVNTRYAQQGSPQSFVDACGASGRLTYLAGADDSSAHVSLPFAFRYWTTDLAPGAQVNITSNGWIGLLGDTSASLSGSIPSTSAPNGVIAAYWRDNYNRSPGMCVATLGSAPNRQWVVEWQNQYHYGSGSESLTYEIVLSESAQTIDLVYQTMSGVSSATVGVEHPSGSAAVGGCPGGGTQCAPGSGSRVRFAPIP